MSAIVVSYNTRQMTLDCLRALIADLNGISSEVWLVDNASKDGTVAAVGEAFPQVRAIASSNNVGFAAGNNLGMRQATGRYFLLMNSDAFPERGAIGAMLGYMEDKPGTAVVGPRLLNGDGSLQVSCFPFPSPWRAWVENLWLPRLFPSTHRLGDYRGWNHDTERQVDWVTGACMLVRREAYERVGGFDERFFMYAEESDWQLRMARAGWRIGFTPRATMVHLGSSGASEKVRMNDHFFQSLDAYSLKHHGVIGLVILRLAMIVGCSLRVIGWSGAWVLVPRLHQKAALKIHLHSRLVARQATTWRINHPAGVPA